MKRANARAMYEVHENCINGFLKKKKKKKQLFIEIRVKMIKKLGV